MDPRRHDQPPGSRRAFLALAGRTGALGAALATGTLVVPSAASAQDAAGDGEGIEPAGIGRELGYAETTAIATTPSTLVVPNLALRVPVGVRPITVEYGGDVSSSVAGGLVALALRRDGVVVHELTATIAAANAVRHVQGAFRIPAGLIGTVTITVQLANRTSKATARVVGTPTVPAFLVARRV